MESATRTDPSAVRMLSASRNPRARTLPSSLPTSDPVERLASGSRPSADAGGGAGRDWGHVPQYQDAPPARAGRGGHRRGDPAAALQYVRKISGFRAPAAHNREVFDRAVDAVAAATAELLDGLEVRGAGVRRAG
ncbi:hypothetical protein SFUMM280S_10604 [Streptomyces fumanus]